MAIGGYRKHLSGEGENRYRSRNKAKQSNIKYKMLLTVVVMNFSVFDDIQYGVRGEVGRVGTSRRAFWKREREEQKSDSFGGSDWAGVRMK